jgi:5'-3' exonuclease
MADRLLAFDTASLYFRAFFGLPSTLRAADGRPVNAVRGLLDFLARFITDYSPTQVACGWDNNWRPTWRVDLVPSYKAHRVAYGVVEEVPADLVGQVPLILEVLAALGLSVIGADDHEADDVLGTFATVAGVPTDVVTGDRDLFQLVDDEREVRVLYCGRGVANHDRVDAAWLLPSTASTARDMSTSLCCAVIPPTAFLGCPGSVSGPRRGWWPTTAIWRASWRQRCPAGSPPP